MRSVSRSGPKKTQKITTKKNSSKTTPKNTENKRVRDSVVEGEKNDKAEEDDISTETENSHEKKKVQ